jgi:hypothetical protein
MTQVGILADADGILPAGVDSVCRVDVGVRPSQPFVFTGLVSPQKFAGWSETSFRSCCAPVSR